MKRKLLLAGVIASFLAFASSLNGPLNAQITTSGGSLPASNLTIGTADFTLQGDDFHVGWGASADFQLEWVNASSIGRISALGAEIEIAYGTVVTFHDALTTNTMLLHNFPDAVGDFADSRLLHVGVGNTIAAMDGSDTYSILEIDIANANHTGVTNVLNGLNIASITGDGDAIEYALSIEDGWDHAIFLQGAATSIRTSANGIVTFQDTSAIVAFDYGTGAGRSTVRVIGRQLGTSSTTNFEIVPANGAAMDGSDTVNMMLITARSDNHTGTGNVLNGINIANITGDADATENAINFGTGWDADIEATTSFDVTIDGNDYGSFRIATGVLTATQVRKLNATPIEVVAAPGAGTGIVIESVRFMLDWNSVAYDSVGGGEDLRLQYASGGSPNIILCDNASCLNADATADAFGIGNAPESHGGELLTANVAVNVTIATSEWAAADDDANGDSPVRYLIRYRVVTLDLS